MFVWDKGYKRSILNFINFKLKPVCGLSVSNKDSHTRKGRINLQYYLTGLEIWNEYNIKIEKYECKYNNVKVYSEKDSFIDIMDELFSDEIKVRWKYKLNVLYVAVDFDFGISSYIYMENQNPVYYK